MKFGSVCSGIEAASVAWHPLDWSAAWLAEIEPFPSSVLAHHYPQVPNVGDMTLIPDWIRSEILDAPDVLVGGTPCQAFSVAGLREGLSDSRGQLTLTFVEIANEIDNARQRLGQPECVIVWENVPGVLSSKDNAFGCFLAGLAGETEPLQPAGGRWPDAGCVYGPQRTIAWRILDAQYFGVAQRRRRVFVVASARDGFDPAEVLFEFDGVRRDTAPSREAGQSTAHDVAPSLVSSGRGVERTGETRGQDPVIATAFRMAAFGEYSDDGTASTMKARDYKDATDLAVQPTPYRVTFCDANGRRKDRPNGGLYVTQPDVSGTLTGAESDLKSVSPVTLPINTQIAMRHNALGERTGMGIGSETDPGFTLQAGHSHAVAAAIGWSEELTAHIELQGTLQRGGDGGRHEGVMQPNMQVRRLTPVECERLQGFPDNYTQVPHRGKPAADGPRYKALGNSMAVPVMAWIGKRINAALGEQP